MQTFSESQKVHVELSPGSLLRIDLSMNLFLLIPWLHPGFLLILFGLGEAQEQTPMTEWKTAFSLESER